MKPLAHGFSPVIDAHAHVGPIWPRVPSHATAADGVRLMDLCGIDQALSSASSFLNFSLREGNRLVHRVTREFPGRILGLCVADPRRPAKSAEDLEHYLGEAGFAGIKLHIADTRLPYSDARYDFIYEAARTYAVPVLAHTFSDAEVTGFLDAAQRFPEVPFIVGHSGGYDWDHSVSRIAAVPNACFDVCCSCPDAGRIEAFVEAAGSERVLFGTDNAFLSPALNLSQVLCADLTHEQKQQILGGNIRRILEARK